MIATLKSNLNLTQVHSSETIEAAYSWQKQDDSQVRLWPPDSVSIAQLEGRGNRT